MGVFSYNKEKDKKMKSTDFLKSKGMEAEPDFITEEYPIFVFTGKELVKLLDDYADIILDETLNKLK